MAFAILLIAVFRAVPVHVTLDVHQYANSSFPPKVTRVASLVVRTEGFSDRPPIMFWRSILGEQEMIADMTRQAERNGDVDVILENPTPTELQWIAKGLATRETRGKPFRLTLLRKSSMGLDEELSMIFGEIAVGNPARP